MKKVHWLALKGRRLGRGDYWHPRPDLLVGRYEGHRRNGRPNPSAQFPYTDIGGLAPPPGPAEPSPPAPCPWSKTPRGPRRGVTWPLGIDHWEDYEDQEAVHTQLAASVVDPAAHLESCSDEVVLEFEESEVDVGLLTS